MYSVCVFWAVFRWLAGSVLTERYLSIIKDTLAYYEHIQIKTLIFITLGPAGHSSSFILNVSNNCKKFYNIVIFLEY